MTGWARLRAAMRRTATQPDAPGVTTVFMRSGFHAHGEKHRFKIRVANRHEVRAQAHELLNDRYASKGYHTQAFTVSADKLTFVAYEGGTPSGTLTISLDTGHGLAADELYGPELGALRAYGARLCEFTKLATLSTGPGAVTLAAMFHIAFVYAHQIHGCTDVVIEVNPRHVGFYTRLLGFEQVGPARMNPRVNAPGVLLRCRFSHIESQVREFRREVVDGGNRRSFYAYSFSETEEREIRERVERALALVDKPGRHRLPWGFRRS